MGTLANSDINGNMALGEQILEAEGLLPNTHSERRRRLYAIRNPAYSYNYYCRTSFYYLVCFGRDKTFR
jgi:hypothetical protein